MMSLHHSNPFIPDRTNRYPDGDHNFLSQEEIFLQEVIRIICDNIDNDQFGVPALAKRVYLSVSQLNRRLNALADCPAGYLIRNIRIQHAAYLLENNVTSVGEIAFEVGFKNQAHFCRSFKQWFGCPPSEYPRQNDPDKSGKSGKFQAYKPL